MKKVIFFDIDGTLVGFNGKMPDSTREALKLARAKGHKIALCTGRSKCQIYPWLLEEEFDGIVAGAGAYVECEGKVIFHQHMKLSAIQKAVRYFQENQAIYGFQTAANVVVHTSQVEGMRGIFRGFGIDEAGVDQIMAGLLVEDGEGFYAEVEKMMYYKCPKPVEAVRAAFLPEMDVTMSSFEEPDESSGEVSGAGVNKATGMQQLIRYFGMDKKDTIAFGDGPNDVEMMQYAQIGVAMGNSVEFLKQHAYMVTDDVESDGIIHALLKLGVI